MKFARLFLFLLCFSLLATLTIVPALAAPTVPVETTMALVETANDAAATTAAATTANTQPTAPTTQQIVPIAATMAQTQPSPIPEEYQRGPMPGDFARGSLAEEFAPTPLDYIQQNALALGALVLAVLALVLSIAPLAKAKGKSRRSNNYF